MAFIAPKPKGACPRVEGTSLAANAVCTSLQRYDTWYHYTNLRFVSESVRESVTRRSTEAIRPALKQFLSLHCWTWMLHQAAH